MLYQLRYRRPRIGVTQGLLELPDTATLEDAYRAGVEYCNSEPDLQFIGVEYAILNKRPQPKPVDATPAQTRRAS